VRRDTTEITERHGGVHSQRALRRARDLLVGHGFARPRLYHIVLLDHASESATSANRFKGAIKALCRKLRQHGIPVRWRACIERDDEKGLHCHVFMLVDATAANPCAIINTKRQGAQAWLHKMLAVRFMDFHLAQPKADMHRVGGTADGRRKNYATLAGPKLDDCFVWISYLAKQRSKPSDIRTIYFSSRDSMSESASTMNQRRQIGDRNVSKVQANRENDAASDEAGRWTRERDDEQPVELWDEVTGKMVKPAVKRPSARAQADAMVAAALQRAASARAGDAADA
jgi:hypothetical protein